LLSWPCVSGQTHTALRESRQAIPTVAETGQKVITIVIGAVVTAWCSATRSTGIHKRKHGNGLPVYLVTVATLL
jgi:hypothetical protein